MSVDISTVSVLGTRFAVGNVAFADGPAGRSGQGFGLGSVPPRWGRNGVSLATTFAFSPNPFGFGRISVNIDDRSGIGTGTDRVEVASPWWNNGADALGGNIAILPAPTPTETTVTSAEGVSAEITTLVPLRPDDVGVVREGEVSVGAAEHQVSAAYDLWLSPDVEGSLAEATITLPYDEADVGGTDEAGLAVYYFDETYGLWYRAAESQTVDTEANTVTAIVDHFSTFAVFRVDQGGFGQYWDAKPVWCIPTGEAAPIWADVVFVTDTSESMGWNDPEGLRVAAAREFVAAMADSDRAGVVMFHSYVYPLIDLTVLDEVGRGAVNAAIDQTAYAGGGTNIGAGVNLANAMLIGNSSAGRVRVEILLTDGMGQYDATVTDQARENNIVIYAVGLGSGVDEALLRGIAEATGGQYLHLESAADLPEVYREIGERVLDDGTDSDADGLTDCEESYGVLASAGMYLPLAELNNDRYVITDPANPDTDGDGLPDGAEMGPRHDLREDPFLALEYSFLIEAGITYFYNMSADPRRIDTDYDGLGDGAEYNGIGGADGNIYKTSPMRADTDSDGVTDPVELALGRNPLKPDRTDCGLGGCTFDRTGVIAYARQYGEAPRQDTPFHPLAGTDCTGFVSQAWHFGGGMPMVFDSPAGPGWAIKAGFYFPAPEGWADEGRLPFGLPPRSWSLSWGVASEFPNYWSSTGEVELIHLTWEEMANSYVPGRPGDIIAYEGDYTDPDPAHQGWDHTAILAGASTTRQRHVIYEHGGDPDPELGDNSQPRRWNNVYLTKPLDEQMKKYVAVIHYEDSPAPDKNNQDPAYHESFGAVP